MPGFCAVHFVGVVLSVLRNVFGLPDLFGKSGNSGFLRYARFARLSQFFRFAGAHPGIDRFVRSACPACFVPTA